jgi:hypothetical protein
MNEKPETMKSEPPKDGSCVLLHYRTRHYSFRTGKYEHSGTKWEQCQWVVPGGIIPVINEPHWSPWCGNSRLTCTDRIQQEDVLDWMPVPANQ